MNLAILVGNISSEIRKIDMQNGGSVTKFRVKTVQQYRQDGELKERSQTHLIDVWSAYLQKDVTPYLKQGQMVEVRGAIESRNAAKQGDPANWTTSIVLRGDGVINVFGGPGSNTSVYAEASGPGSVTVDHSDRRPAPVTGASDGGDDLDDDVPF